MIYLYYESISAVCVAKLLSEKVVNIFDRVVMMRKKTNVVTCLRIMYGVRSIKNV